VVLALEELNLPFTGAASHFYEPTREQMKEVCQKFGIRAPRGLTFKSPEAFKFGMDGLHYPMIVKHPNSYGSIGLIKESRVNCVEQLETQVDRMVREFGGALVEEFIEGREFSVLISENPDNPSNPVTYVPVEILFPSGETFKHTDMKWYRFNEMSVIPVKDEPLSTQLRDMSAKLFVGLDGTGYGRCDIRMNAKGELFMLKSIRRAQSSTRRKRPVWQITSCDLTRVACWLVDLLFRAALARHKQKIGAALKANES